MRGDCTVEGRIRIEGRVEGDVRAAGLELTESGSVKGSLVADEGTSSESFVIAGTVDGRVQAPRVDVRPTGAVLKGIEAEEAQVRGRVEGGIKARRRLHLDKTAVVEGDVRALALSLDEGGQVNGTIVMGARAATSTRDNGASTDVQDDEAATPEDEAGPSLHKASA